MIIRSQDKKTIVNFDNVTNIFCCKDKTSSIYANFDYGEYDVLGTYSTEEKAIKVLDMIQDSYSRMIEVANHIVQAQKEDTFVFQMPQDSEV